MKSNIIGQPWLLLWAIMLMAACTPPVEVDVLITGGWVLDGSHSPARRLDVGVTGERISYVGVPGERKVIGKAVVDIDGLYLAPGFIDPHTHVERELSDPKQKSNLRYLRQGVTTVFAGNDGSSPMPVKRKLDEWDRNGIGTNAALLVGHGSVRRVVMGMEAKEADAQALKEMEKLVHKSMEEGAFGISTGLLDRKSVV